MKGWPWLSLNILKHVFGNHKAVTLWIFEVFGVSHCQVHQRAPSLRSEQLISKGSEVTAGAGGRAGISQGSPLAPADPTWPLAGFSWDRAGVAVVLSVWHRDGR